MRFIVIGNLYLMLFALTSVAGDSAGFRPPGYRKLISAEAFQSLETTALAVHKNHWILSEKKHNEPVHLHLLTRPGESESRFFTTVCGGTHHLCKCKPESGPEIEGTTQDDGWVACGLCLCAKDRKSNCVCRTPPTMLESPESFIGRAAEAKLEPRFFYADLKLAEPSKAARPTLRLDSLGAKSSGENAPRCEITFAIQAAQPQIVDAFVADSDQPSQSQVVSEKLSICSEKIHAAHCRLRSPVPFSKFQRMGISIQNREIGYWLNAQLIGRSLVPNGCSSGMSMTVVADFFNNEIRDPEYHRPVDLVVRSIGVFGP